MNKVEFLPEGWTNDIQILDRNILNNYIENQETLQGIVEKCDDKYNLYINLGNGIVGQMPREEIEGINIEENGLPKTNLCTGKVHKYIQFKIKDMEDNRVILSRKKVQQEALDWVKNELNIGDTIKGIVKNIKPYGAFIEIGGGVVGLAYIEDLSIARIKSPFERLKIGQKIDVVVKNVEKETGKVVLSYKETLGTWEENVKNFETGMKVKGIVRETEKNKNGIFIELTPNLVGMAEYKEGLRYGEKVDVYIKKIDKEKKKVKLFIN